MQVCNYVCRSASSLYQKISRKILLNFQTCSLPQNLSHNILEFSDKLFCRAILCIFLRTLLHNLAFRLAFSSHRFLHSVQPMQKLKIEAKGLSKLFNAIDNGEKKKHLLFCNMIKKT